MTFDEFKNRLDTAATEEAVKAAYASYFKIKYDYFWSVYEYVKSQETISGIHAKLDRLTDESQRRFEGEFYTPLRFGRKAILYFTKVLGKNWYKTGKYRIWDMAAGTGNLEYHLPAEAYKYMYLSTLHADEADHLKKVFPGAACFQYDYLNDDVEYLFSEKEPSLFKPKWKLPKKLRDELADPGITWVVYINPPFATAQDAKRKRSKTGVSKTKIDALMDRAEAGHAKRELLVQFMFRIVHELPRNTYLGMFSKLYLNAPDSIEYRDKYLNYKYERGFIFHSKCFHGISGNFPVCFLIWDLSKRRRGQTVAMDILNNDAQAVGVKHLRLIGKDDGLNKWVPRPQNSGGCILPALSNGINVKEGNVDTRHRARPDFLASMASRGNDFQSARSVVILSSPNTSAGAFTIIKENFEKALILHAVRKIPKPTWLNDRNQFLIPSAEPSREFTTDCVVWSLFAASNETTALKDVKYMGATYQIKNNFYPFRLEEVRQWDVKDRGFERQIAGDQNRFAALWLAKNKLSDEAKEVIRRAKAVYMAFYANLNKMTTKKWKIDCWDAGWYQIRRCLSEHNIASDELKALSEANERLANKILPLIEEYGFLDKDEVYGEI